MSKELAERLEKLSMHLKGTVYLHPEHVTVLDEAIAALRSEPASGQLSAEQIEKWRSAVKRQWPGVTEINALCDMALSSLRGTFADGIEAAAKALDARSICGAFRVNQ